jgi:hypothetical protein
MRSGGAVQEAVYRRAMRSGDICCRRRGAGIVAARHEQLRVDELLQSGTEGRRVEVEQQRFRQAGTPLLISCLSCECLSKEFLLIS